MTHRFRQTGRNNQLGIVVGVGVNKTWRDPAAASVDHPSAGFIQRLFGYVRDHAITNCQVAHTRRGTCAIE